MFRRHFELYLTMVVAVALAAFLRYPPPPMSAELLSWNNTGEYMDFNSHSIFFKDIKGSGKDVLLCIHGFPTSGYDWIKVLPSLQKKFERIVIPDMIGYGFSDKPTSHNYSIFEQADIMETLLGKLNVKELHILAHDYGDTVAQELIARFEDRRTKKSDTFLQIKTVCLLNGGLFSGDTQAKTFTKGMFPETNFPKLVQKIGAMPVLGPIVSHLMFYIAFRRGFGEVFGPETQPTEEEFIDFYAQVLYKHGNRASHGLLHYMEERRKNRERWVGSMQLTSIPVHTIYGPADPVNPPPFDQHYRKIIPNPSITVLEDHIGHYPQWEAPKEVAKDYNRFIAKHGVK